MMLFFCAVRREDRTPSWEQCSSLLHHLDGGVAIFANEGLVWESWDHSHKKNDGTYFVSLASLTAAQRLDLEMKACPEKTLCVVG